MHTLRSSQTLSSSFNQSPKCRCSCCCCCCYAANLSMAAVNPIFLHKGLNQSILIQWSLSKRLIFHGRIRQSFDNTFGFSSFDDLDQSYCYKKLSAFKERRNQRQRGFVHKKKEQLLSNVRDDCVNGGEVMLSLLTDEVGLEYNDVKNIKMIDFKCDEVVKMKSSKKSENLDLKKEGKMKSLKKSGHLDMQNEGSFGGLEGNKDFEVKSDGYYVGQTSPSAYKNGLRKHCTDEVVNMKSLKKSENLDLKKEGSFGGLEGSKDFEVKCDGYYVGQPSSSAYKNGLKKDYTEEVVKMKSLRKSENLDLKKEGSFGGLEGNKDLEVKSHGYYVAQPSSSAYKNDLRKDCKGCIDEVVATFQKQQESVQEVEGLLGKDTVVVRQDWRKKSEKKLVNEESNISMNVEPCKQHSHEMFKITDETSSRMKYKRLTEMSDKDKTVIVSTCSPENKLKVIPEVWNGSGTCDQIQKDGGSRHSSHGSGPKGPSDEMWHVTDASTQSGSSENGSLVKTNGRSLWTIIGNVVRLHWKSSRFGSHTPTSSGAKGSSYVSTSTETWFSSHEPDDPNDETVRKKIIKGLDPPLAEGPSRNTSLPMIKESSFSLKRSPEIKKMVKSRKLVHKDQVFEDNFDEWEETYSLANKQLKEDEMFMREALLEAKKAADVWEVPVGAVLVKDGKIIARGHNMVEELQDSTAHAEMISIRQGSTNISSWRLSDTTLYVTLEPCPMCAGAILQSRIHTVVWGAPNKLLGVDGSWIRLFCDEDGGSSSMPTDIPPAPTHPFHPNMAVRRGVLAAECGEVMQHFFQLRRKKKAEPTNPPSSISVSHHHHHSNFLSKIHHAFNAIFCL